jgi:hypothetical protein
MKNLLPFLIFSYGIFICGSVSAVESTWQAGVASTCVTPDEPLPLCGYDEPVRKRPFESVLDDIHTKALALKFGDDRPAVLITLDACMVVRPLARAIAQAVIDQTGLPRERIWFNISHSHSTPIMGLEPESFDWCPVPDESMREKIRIYSRQLIKKIAATAQQAIDRLEPATLSWTNVGRIGFPFNRRKFDENGKYIGMAPNPNGSTDRSVPVLRVMRQGDQRPLAVVFGAACHPVTLGGNSLALSGDYAGIAQRDIENRLPGTIALFVQGCGADANSEPRGTQESVLAQGDQLAREVCRVLVDEKFRQINGRLKTEYEEVPLPLAPCGSRVDLEAKAKSPYLGYTAQRLLKTLDAGEPVPTEWVAPFALWRFGDDLTVVALPSEAVSEYATAMRKKFGPDRVWTAAYSNEKFGYIPSEKIVHEGGFEARGLSWPGLGWFGPEIQKTILDIVERLDRQSRTP